MVRLHWPRRPPVDKDGTLDPFWLGKSVTRVPRQWHTTQPSPASRAKVVPNDPQSPATSTRLP